jgi:hypothetical protein
VQRFLCSQRSSLSAAYRQNRWADHQKVSNEVQHDIIRKLSEELREPIKSERQVVYLLVEVRKLLELTGELDNRPALKFHCDWLVHSELRGPQAQDVVRKFNRYQELTEALHAKEQTPPEAMQVLAEVDAVLKLANFRQDLREFLEQHGLDSSLTKNGDKWHSFLGAYCGIISDCPLKCVIQGLQFTEAVVLSVFDAKLQGTPYQLAIRWSWRAKRSDIECNIIRYY